MNPHIIGIDPGKQGAIALLSKDLKTVLFWLMSEVEERKSPPFEDIVKGYGVVHAYIEKSQAMPGQGVTSMFTYGMGFGKILGWCEMLSLPYTLVPPRTWTKEIHKGVSGETAKERSLHAAKRLFPGERLLASKNSVRLHPGLVDALLIAEYGRRIYV